MLTQIKNYVIIALIIFGSVQTYRLNTAQHERDTLQNAINHAQEVMGLRTEKQRLKERDAAKTQAESQKRTESIMKSNPPKECEKLFQWMINPKI